MFFIFINFQHKSPGNCCPVWRSDLRRQASERSHRHEPSRSAWMAHRRRTHGLAAHSQAVNARDQRRDLRERDSWRLAYTF
jgi:hypothetical protein